MVGSIKEEEEKEHRDTTSIKINSYIWKQVKKHCIDKDLEISKYLGQLIKRDLKL